MLDLDAMLGAVVAKHTSAAKPSVARNVDRMSSPAEPSIFESAHVDIVATSVGWLQIAQLRLGGTRKANPDMILDPSGILHLGHVENARLEESRLVSRDGV